MIERPIRDGKGYNHTWAMGWGLGGDPKSHPLPYGAENQGPSKNSGPKEVGSATSFIKSLFLLFLKLKIKS